MTASLCGVPLFTPSHGNSMDGMDQFLSSAICFSDLLSDNGYYLSYIGGADLNFAGKGKLLQTHSFEEVVGKEELLSQIDDPDKLTSWGFRDDVILDRAYSRFEKLSNKEEKFGLFLLTLDTHHASKVLSEGCEGVRYGDGSNSTLNSIMCADRLIAKFINKISKSSYSDDTLIVLVSDHLAMKNAATKLLEEGNRTNMFMIIDPNNPDSREISSLGSTLDIGTTIMPFVGYTGNIGFGRDLITHSDEQETEFIHNNLTRWKQPITEFWKFPSITKYLQFDIDNELLHIDNRRFKLPVLIELDESLNTVLRFQFHKRPEHKSLIEHRQEIASNEYFILIDFCENVQVLDKSLGNEGYCLLAGQGNSYSLIKRVEGNIFFDVEDVKNLLGISGDAIVD